jgi:hypothetical protein
MFLVKNINGTSSASRAANEIFMALTSTGVGPGVNIESHSDTAIEVMVVDVCESPSNRSTLGEIIFGELLWQLESNFSDYDISGCQGLSDNNPSLHLHQIQCLVRAELVRPLVFIHSFAFISPGLGYQLPVFFTTGWFAGA